MSRELTAEQIDQISRLLREGHPQVSVAKNLGMDFKTMKFRLLLMGLEIRLDVLPRVVAPESKGSC